MTIRLGRAVERDFEANDDYFHSWPVVAHNFEGDQDKRITCDDATLTAFRRGFDGEKGYVRCNHEIDRPGRLGKLADLVRGRQTEHGEVAISFFSRGVVQGNSIDLLTEE